MELECGLRPRDALFLHYSGHGLWLLAETGQDVRRHRVGRVHCAMRPQSDQRWVLPFVPLCILL
jgi:hypothetical protein